MLNNVKYYTYTEKSINEDAYGINDSFIFVLDGATGLGKKEWMHPQSDAFWYVNEIQKALLEQWHNYPSPLSLLKQTCRKLYTEYQSACKQPISLAAMPSACLSLFYENGDDLLYYGLGDCYGIIEFTDGHIEILSDPVLETLDQNALKEMKTISEEKKIPFFEARSFIQQTLIQNRLLRNQPNGYHALDLTWSDLEMIPTHTWKKKDVHRILCASDGFYEIMHYGLLKDTKDLFDHISTDSDDLLKKLYQAQEKDSQALLCPRFKLRDDCTFVYAEVY